MKKTLYLYKGGELVQRNHTLALKTKTGSMYIPIEEIDLIICFSDVTLNKRTFSLLNKYSTSILFYNYYGNYIGRFTPKRYIDGKVLLKQVQCYEDDIERQYIATQILISANKNMLALLKYYHKKGMALTYSINQLEEYCKQFSSCNNVNELMIIEAKSKQIYYAGLDIILANYPYKLQRRSKRPPHNEVNAMMSYGYAILYGHLLGVIDRSSLYPQISFIHSLTSNCDSLQFDIADIFKPVIIDRLILRLIRKNQIKPEYFQTKDGACYLSKAGCTFFIEEIEKTLISTYPYNHRYYSYKSLLSRDIHELSNYIKGTNKSYKPFTMRW